MRTSLQERLTGGALPAGAGAIDLLYRLDGFNMTTGDVVQDTVLIASGAAIGLSKKGREFFADNIHQALPYGMAGYELIDLSNNVVQNGSPDIVGSFIQIVGYLGLALGVQELKKYRTLFPKSLLEK